MLGKKRRIKSQSNRAKRRELERSIDKKKLDLDNISPLSLLSKIKYDLPPQQSQNLISSLSDEQYDQIVGDLLPLEYSKIRDKSVIYSRNEFLKELIWYKDILSDFTVEINNFLVLENLFESNFLKGNYTDCEKIIVRVEKEICVSHWTIEKKLLIAEFQYGFKKNKEILTEIISSKLNNITSLFAKYQSIKVEKNQSFLKYQEMVDEFLDGFDDPRIREYLEYKLNIYSRNNYKYAGFILGAESSSSIIDMYLAFVNLITMAASRRSITIEESNVITKTCFELQPKINDNRLFLIDHLLGDLSAVPLIPSDNQYLEILDLYTTGNYANSMYKASDYLKQKSNCFEIYIIFVKCCIRLGSSPNGVLPVDSIGSRSMLDILNILLKNDDTQSSLTNLNKTYNTVGRSSWGFKAFTFFLNQHTIEDNEVNVVKMSHIFTSSLNPIFSIFTKDYQSAKKYLDTIVGDIVNQNVKIFWMNVCAKLNFDDATEIPSATSYFRRQLYIPQILQAKTKYIDALQTYKNLYANNDFVDEWAIIHNQEEVIHGMLYCQLALNNWQGAMELVTEANLRCPNMAIRLRNDFLISKISNTVDENLVSDISTSIFLHQYQKNISPNDLWIAYDNFLGHHGLNFPSEIELLKDQFDKEKLVYFLRFICKPEVYDSSYLFDSQEHLENERIEVCLLLSNLDEDNFEIYFNEISEISRNQLIRQGIKQIDESKIYVDVTGIRKAIDKDLSEGFIRLINLMSLPLSQIDKLDTSNDSYLISYYDKLSDGSKTTGSKIRITTYSKFEQCTELFFKIRDMFIASNEFGIDTYLSMRIRHGTLLGEIRSVFESYELITKKDESSEKYQDNQYWLEKTQFKYDYERVIFNEILADFSANIDNISNELKDEQLQINTEKRQTDGLFDYSFFENELLEPLKWLEVVENYDEFFERSVDLLWERTEIILSIIRDEISGPIKTKILDLLSEMAANLELRFDKHEHPEINDLIRNIMLCKTDIGNKLDKIAEWFNRTKNKVINEFYLDLPIDASVGTLKRVKEYVNFNPSIDNRCGIKFEGDTFPHFTYIMQNLLHNILKHSALPPDKVQVIVLATEEDGELSLTITNNFSENLDLENVNRQINKTRKLLTEPYDNDRNRGEGGTGYLKIRKTIVTDLKEKKYEIHIANVDESRIFKTVIKFNILKLRKIYNENTFN